MPELKTTTLRDFEIKDAAKGEVSAVFSTLNVVDHDGDVTVPGAFKQGQKVRISAYNHASWGGALPVGKGAISADDVEAVMSGRFFMNTTHGLDTFNTVKEMSDDQLQEWSYGFDVLDSSPGEFEGRQVRFLRSMDVHEVSPVLLGAGINTRTLAAKSLAKADLDDIVKALLGHDPHEVAEAIAAGDLKFSDHLTFVATTVKQVHTRLADIANKRAEQGKSLGQESQHNATVVADELEPLIKALRDVSTIAAGPPEVHDLDLDVRLAEEHARFRL